MQIRANTIGILCYEACHALGSSVSLLAALIRHAKHTRVHTHAHKYQPSLRKTHNMPLYAYVHKFKWYLEALPLISCIH